jgi:hypothetical protein
VRGSIALFFGTRPQVIKASVLRDCLETVAPVVAVDTGQHYDYALHRVHFDQLDVREPDACLGIGSGSHAAQTGAILTACEAWLLQHRPALAVVIETPIPRLMRAGRGEAGRSRRPRGSGDAGRRPVHGGRNQPPGG